MDEERPNLKLAETEGGPEAEEKPPAEPEAEPKPDAADLYGVLVTSNGARVNVQVHGTPLLMVREMLRVAHQAIEQAIGQQAAAAEGNGDGQGKQSPAPPK